MATITPTPKIFKISLKGIRTNCFLKNKMGPKVTTVIKSRYQTNNPSFSVINLPSIAVKPAKKTAI